MQRRCNATDYNEFHAMTGKQLQLLFNIFHVAGACYGLFQFPSTTLWPAPIFPNVAQG